MRLTGDGPSGAKSDRAERRSRCDWRQKERSGCTSGAGANDQERV